MEQHEYHYISTDGMPDGGYLFMKQSSFMARTSALFSTFKDSPRMDHESAIYWFERAVNSGMIFC